MKQVHETLDRILPEIIAMSEDIYRHPELGFKEFRTREKTIEALDKAGIPHEDVAYTGIRAVLDYDYAEDEQAVELQRRIAADGLPAVLEQVCGLQPGERLTQMILNA